MKIHFWLLIFFWGSGDAFWTITKYIWFISFITHSLRYFQSSEWKAQIPSHFKPFINVLNQTKLQSNWNDRFAAEVEKVLNQILINLVSRKFQANWSIVIFLLQQLVKVQHRYIRVGLRQRHSHITKKQSACLLSWSTTGSPSSHERLIVSYCIILNMAVNIKGFQ